MNSSSTTIGADYRWIGQHGIGRFAYEVLSRMDCRAVVGKTPLLHPIDPLVQGMAVRKSGCQVYFSPGFNPPFQNRVPSVFTIHDLIHIRVKSEQSLAKSIFYRYVVMPAARQSPAVLTVSEYSKSQIVEWANLSPDRVHVVGNGVSETFTPHGPSADLGSPYLLYVGNYKPHKNVPRLLQAFARSAEARHFNLGLVGQAQDDLVALAESLKIRNRVHFLGAKTNHDLATLYRGARALLCPSLEEGFGLPVLEAMACGTPALVGAGHAAEEVADGAAIKCNALDVDSISAAIDQVAAGSQFRSELISKGIERAKHFTWDRVARRVSDAIQSVQ